jgi:hypothetical protein
VAALGRVATVISLAADLGMIVAIGGSRSFRVSMP